MICEYGQAIGRRSDLPLVPCGNDAVNTVTVAIGNGEPFNIAMCQAHIDMMLSDVKGVEE
jgi:hypothetical protein